MCGRYYLSIDLGNLSFVDNLSGYDFEDNFNIAPQASVPVVIENSLVNCIWGYYPPVSYTHLTLPTNREV